EMRDVGKAERAGPALDRVRRAENAVEAFGVGLLHAAAALQHALDVEQLRLHRGDAFETLLEERRVESPQVDRHAAYPRTLRTTSTSCSGLNGLTIHPVAPALRPWSRLPACDSVVSMRIGVNLYCSMARSDFTSVMPSIFGILTSAM